MTKSGFKTMLVIVTAMALLTKVAAAQDQVGVTSAVNQQATLERVSNRRTITVGENINFRDKIITSRDGLTQVLFVDGSTFMVGSNSQVVIDEFVYNPADGSGALVSEITKGALRFVGGKLSKNDGQVEFKTPVGILGVRGGIAEIDLEPECLSNGSCPVMTASLIFGDELTLTENNGKKRRVYQQGHAFVAYGDGSNTRIVPIKRLKQDRFRERLSGDPGQDGGASVTPTDTDVVESGLPAGNSSQSTVTLRFNPAVVQTSVAPDPEVPGVGTTTGNILVSITEPAQSGAQREEIPEDDDTIIPGRTLTGVYGTPPSLTTYNGAATITDPGANGILVRVPSETVNVTLTPTGPGTPPTVAVGDILLPFPSEEGETSVEPRFSEQFDREILGGTILRGPSGFALYHLLAGEEGSGPGDEAAPDSVADSLVVVVGNPTARSVFYPDNPDARPAQLRTYMLGTEYAREARGIVSDIPLVNPNVALTFGNDFLSAAAETPFFMIERDNLGPSTRTLYAALNIEGQGPSQRSLIVSDAGIVYGFDGSGGDAVGVGGTRRGSFRTAANASSTFMRGGTGSVEIGNANIFTALAGSNGDAFVYTSGLAGGGLLRNSNSLEREFIDVNLSDPLASPTSGNQYGSGAVAATLSTSSPLSGLMRGSGVELGFAAAMVESADGAIVPFRSLGSGGVVLEFDAPNASVGGLISVGDITDADPIAAGITLAFGFDVTGEHPNSSSSRSAYLDRYRFAANSTGPGNTQGGDTTLLHLDTEGYLRHRPTTSANPKDPGTYVVSSGLVPQQQLFDDAGVTECQCDYLTWGWWGTQTEFLDGSLPGGRRADIVHLGTFATGDIPSVAELPTTGSAAFNGHAIGNVATSIDGASAQYVAVGNMNMTYDFGERTGTLNISDFDNHSFAGTVVGSPLVNRFDGALSGSGLTGSATGAFARGPAGPANGVVGSFNVGGEGYSAAGSFLGSQ